MHVLLAYQSFRTEALIGTIQELQFVTMALIRGCLSLGYVCTGASWVCNVMLPLVPRKVLTDKAVATSLYVAGLLICIWEIEILPNYGASLVRLSTAGTVWKETAPCSGSKRQTAKHV